MAPATVKRGGAGTCPESGDVRPPRGSPPGDGGLPGGEVLHQAISGGRAVSPLRVRRIEYGTTALVRGLSGLGRFCTSNA